MKFNGEIDLNLNNDLILDNNNNLYQKLNSESYQKLHGDLKNDIDRRLFDLNNIIFSELNIELNMRI